MTKTYILDWCKAALIRAVRTFAEVLLSMIVVGSPISEIQWGYSLSVSGVAALATILAAVAGLPEAKIPKVEKQQDVTK